MPALLTPRILARTRGRYRQLELDEAAFTRSRDLLTRALEGGHALTRKAAYDVLAAGGVAPDGQRGIHILEYLAQLGVLCFGAPDGKQQTFVLLDEWIPTSRALARDEALAELAERYFTGHGPATLDDFVWWSGLTKTDARAALDAADPCLAHETIEDRSYWCAADTPASSGLSTGQASPPAYLLPMYDEYTVGYKDRSAALDPAYAAEAGNGIFRPVIVVKGRVVGTWTRTLKKQDTVSVSTHLLEALTPSESLALDAAVRRYGAFLGRSVA
jgi:hypothetical protein